jgi:hypothetical protein
MNLNGRVLDFYRSNRMYLPILFLLGLMLGFGNVSLADSSLDLGALMKITVDTETLEIPLILNQEGTGFKLAVPGEKLVFSDGDEITLHYLRGMFDPILVIGVAAVDYGAPSTFGFAIVTPLNPTISKDSVLSVCEIAGALSDGSSDGVSVTPSLNPGILKCTIDGIGILNVGLSLYSPLGITTYPSGGGAVTASTRIDCSIYDGGKCDSFDMEISFTGSGGNDGFAFAARHCLDEESCLTPGDEEIKVEICHKPGTRAEKTMKIPESALGGHLGHGDTVGACN